MTKQKKTQAELTHREWRERLETNGFDPDEVAPRPKAVKYFTRTDIARRLGLHQQTLMSAKLPPADVILGDRRGWTGKTVEAWIHTRGKRATKTPR